MLAIFMSISISQALAQAGIKSDDKTIVYLKKFSSDCIKSMLNKTPETMSSYFDENVRLMPAFQKTIIGESAVLSYYKAFSNRFNIKEYQRTETETDDLGRMVLEVGLFTMKMELNASGKPCELTGTYFDLWGKKANGSLSLITQAWNYDHAIDFTRQLKFSEVAYADVALSSHVPINNSISLELAALNLLIEATVSQHDAFIWSQFYTGDAIVCQSGLQLFRGKKEIDGFLAAHCRELPVFEKLNVRNDRIDDLGAYVIEYASHIAIVRNGDWSGSGIGKDLRVWRREKDGSLKIFRQLGSYD